MVATCSRTPKCNTIRWLYDEATPDPPPSQAANAGANTAANAMTDLGPYTCAYEGCPQKGKIAAKCSHHMCKPHCQVSGGCLDVVSHAVSKGVIQRSTVAVPPPDVPPPPPTQPALDPFANPHHASQIAPIFTETVAREQEREETTRSRAAILVNNSARANRSVAVSAWKKDGAAPTNKTFQSGNGTFEWPYLPIDENLLVVMGLMSKDALAGNGEQPDVELYELDPFGMWTGIELGHVVHVTEGTRICLKLAEVNDCPRLEELSKPQPKAPHLRNNLAAAPPVGLAQQPKPIARSAVKHRLSNSPPQPPARRTNPPSRITIKQEPHASSSRSNAPPRITIKQEPGTTVPTHGRPSASRPVQVSSNVRVKTDYNAVASSSRSVMPKPEPLDPDILYLDSDESYDVAPPVGVQNMPVEVGSGDDEDEDEDDFEDLEGLESQWPGDFYACDIIDCFNALRQAAKSGNKKVGAQREIFNAFFPNCRYVRQTCFDNRKRFNLLPYDLKVAAKKAGYTSDGLWSNVMKNAPSLKGKGRALTIRATTKTAVTKRAKPIQAREVIELSD